MVRAWSWKRPGGVNAWICDDCDRQFDIIDEQPTVKKVKANLDVTTFGDPQKVFIVQEIIERYCSSCA